VPPSPVLSNAPLPQAPLVLQQETPLFAPPAYATADDQVIQFNRNPRPAPASEESVTTAEPSVYESAEDSSSLNSEEFSASNSSISSKSSKAASLASVKELLTKLASQVNLDEYHPLFQTDNYRILLNLAGSDIEEEQFKNSLLLQIKKDFYQLRKSQMTSLQNVYQLAENLLRLKELFSSRNLAPFYATIKAQFGLSQRNFGYYAQIYSLLNSYERFRYCSVSFTVLRSAAKKIEMWFNSDEAKQLEVSNPLSPSFWKRRAIGFETFDSIQDSALIFL